MSRSACTGTEVDVSSERSMALQRADLSADGGCVDVGSFMSSAK